MMRAPLLACCHCLVRLWTEADVRRGRLSTRLRPRFVRSRCSRSRHLRLAGPQRHWFSVSATMRAMRAFVSRLSSTTISPASASAATAPQRGSAVRARPLSLGRHIDRRGCSRRYRRFGRGNDVVSSQYATIAAEQTRRAPLRGRRRPDGWPTGDVCDTRRWEPAKAQRGTIIRSVSEPDRSIRFYLFYGPDDAGSRALADKLLKSLNAEKIFVAGRGENDPALLASEAAAISLFGGARLISIDPAGDEIVEGVEALLDTGAVESPVVAVGGALRKTSALVKLVEANEAALAHASYAPEGRDAERMVGDAGRADGLQIDSATASRSRRRRSTNTTSSVARQSRNRIASLGAAGIDHHALGIAAFGGVGSVGQSRAMGFGQLEQPGCLAQCAGDGHDRALDGGTSSSASTPSTISSPAGSTQISRAPPNSDIAPASAGEHRRVGLHRAPSTTSSPRRAP